MTIEYRPFILFLIHNEDEINSANISDSTAFFKSPYHEGCVWCAFTSHILVLFHKKHECLLINGARQVGKTYIIEKFGKDNYKQYVYINFLESEELKNIFEGSLEPVEIYKRISLYIPKVKLIENNTLIFIDEM